MSDIARSLREREQAFEAKFKMEEEQNFKILARRNYLFGKWIAEKLKLDDHASEHYAIETVFSSLEEPGDHNLIRNARVDLFLEGHHLTQQEINEILVNLHQKSVYSYYEEYPYPLEKLNS